MSVQVTMLQTRLGEDGSPWLKDQTYTATDAFARLLVSSNLATATFSQVPQSALTDAQVQAVQALVDGSGVDVSFARSHDSLPQGYVMDAGSGNVLPVMRVTVNAATDVIAATRIAAGGANTFESSISGASEVGEVLPISVGAGVITSVHVGSSAGASQTLDADGTVTVNEIGKWVCDLADECNVVYVRFAPPRGSGRYCDVSIVGKARV